MKNIIPINKTDDDFSGHLREIDSLSTADKMIDIMSYFSETELPPIYRLGIVSYQSYLLNGKLSKVKVIYDGDRETLLKIYYLDDRNTIFYIKYIYDIYSPPKWQEGAQIIESRKSEYFIMNKSIQPTMEQQFPIKEYEIQQDIDKMVLLNNTFYPK